MSDFNPFLNLSEKSDDELLNDLTRIYSMISYYYNMGNSALSDQLQLYRDTYLNEMSDRSDKKRSEKENKDSVVIDSEKQIIPTKETFVY